MAPSRPIALFSSALAATLALFSCALAATLALTACQGSTLSADAYTIEAVECEVASASRGPDAAFSPLGGDTFEVTGWSHTSPAETSLARDPSTYGLRRSSYAPDASCGGANSLEIVLVKRLVDWDKQHMNGIEAALPRKSVRFSDVTDIVLVLRLRPELSTIPDPEQLAAHFADVLSAEEIAELDTGKVNLELTLFGEGLTAEHPFLNAGTIIEIDQDAWKQEWVRVTVPIDALAGYTEVAYQRTPAELAEYPELFVRGLRINPESVGGRTLRHFQLDDFELGATPELFKELGLSIARIEVGHTASS